MATLACQAKPVARFTDTATVISRASSFLSYYDHVTQSPICYIGMNVYDDKHHGTVWPLSGRSVHSPALTMIIKRFRFALTRSNVFLALMLVLKGDHHNSPIMGHQPFRLLWQASTYTIRIELCLCLLVLQQQQQ